MDGALLNIALERMNDLESFQEVVEQVRDMSRALHAVNCIVEVVCVCACVRVCVCVG